MHDSANTQRCSIDRSVQGEFWAIASQTGLLRKPNPTPEHLNGTAFRLRHLAETAARNRRSDWDAISQWGPRGNYSPESALETGRGFPEDRNSRPPLDKMIRSLRRMRNIQGVSQSAGNRNVPSCRQHFTATAKTRAGNRSHLRGLGGRSQRHVIEAHISYGLPNSIDTRCLRRLTKR